MIPIYIPTKGRAHKQKTYSQLPVEFQEYTKLVVPRAEFIDYTRFYPGRVLMSDAVGIAATRDEILDYAYVSGQRYIVMLDDDLTLQKRHGVPSPIRNSTPEEVMEAFAWLEDTLKKGYAHCGWSIRFNAFATPGEEMSPGRMMHCLAYDLEVIKKTGARFSKGVETWHSMDDFNMTLQLLTAGYPNVVSLTHRMNPSTSNASGGASTWRTLQTQNASARRMKELFPDFVRLREKRNWQGMEGAVMYDITANWKDALEYGVLHARD